MGRSSRRAITRVAAVAAGAAVLAGPTVAQAQERPESVGNGVPTGQVGVQLFNYGGYLNNGGGTGTANPVTGVSEGCATSTTAACRAERLEALFAFLQRKGVTNIELFGHAGFPTSNDLAGLQAYRALMDKYGLHAGGWHGSMNEAQWDTRINAARILGADYIGSGGVADPGINSYGAVLASAQALNRLGKRAVEAGVGPAYIHNHEQEFDRKYADDGVLKTAFDIIMDRTDPRYVVAEVDAFWSSDAFNDDTGAETAALINKYPNRVKLLHAKDGINVTQNGNNSSRAGSPRAFGTGEVDYRPIFAAAKDRVQYYHQEQDGGTLTDADTSLTNIAGTGPNVTGAVLGFPTSFPEVPAGTPAAANVVPVVLQNTGAAPLTITNITIGSDTGDAGDFQIVSQNCTAAGGGGALAPGAPWAEGPRGTCTVNVGFKPTKTNYTSVARLQITSNADNATERVLLVGRSGNQSLGGVGGTVPSVLQLSIPAGGSFGTFVPGVAATYTTALGATVTSTAGNATLTVTDPDTGAATSGRLVNGAFTLTNPLTMRAVGLGDTPLPSYTALNTDGSARVLRTWNGPVTNENLTLGFQQAVTATEPLRAGDYSKTLVFELSTTAP